MFERKRQPLADSETYINYKDLETLNRFLSPQGKILPRRRIGCDAKVQHRIREAIQRARFVGLLGYGS